jgi:hypothetical protein
MKSEQKESTSATVDRIGKALLEEKLAFDAWLESYEDSREAGGGQP